MKDLFEDESVSSNPTESSEKFKHYLELLYNLAQMLLLTSGRIMERNLYLISFGMWSPLILTK